ncbi:hypothetical protein C8Q78DRAFT_1026488 [Trametes maxima]|nr:hypothetical protein C8Q78DRAFT_1026488 [Trametes maxima]
MPLDLNGYTAHLTCDGAELEVYNVKNEGPQIISCWVASEEGKKFSVSWGDKSAAICFNVMIRMDGRVVMRKGHEKASSGTCDGMYVEPGMERPFVFSRLVLTDDESAISTRTYEDLGTIRLTMTRVQRYKLLDIDAPSAAPVPEIGPMHEKSKKAGVHAVSFGDVESRRFRTLVKTPIGTEKEPFATFIFRYRPIELLRANGIVPLPPKPDKGKKRPGDTLEGLRDPSPSSSKHKRTSPPAKTEPADEDDNDDEHLTFLEEQLAMMQQRVERARAAKRPRTDVKREVSPICVPSSSQHEVIDLT